MWVKKRYNEAMLFLFHGDHHIYYYQDSEDITNVELADDFQQMWVQKYKCNNLFLFYGSNHTYLLQLGFCRDKLHFQLMSLKKRYNGTMLFLLNGDHHIYY